MYALGDVVLESDVPFGLAICRKSRPAGSLSLEATLSDSDFRDAGRAIAARSRSVAIGFLDSCHFELESRGRVGIWLRETPHYRSLSSPLFVCGFAAVLRSLGFIVLNGSAVATRDGRALVLLSHSGSGKSALAMGAERYLDGLISDELIVLDCRQGVPQVLGSLRYTKLWPDLWKKYSFDEEEGERLEPYCSKRRFLLSSKTTARYPIKSFVFIEPNSRITASIERVAARSAIRRLAWAESKWICSPLDAKFRPQPMSFVQILQHVPMVELSWNRKKPNIEESISTLASLC